MSEQGQRQNQGSQQQENWKKDQQQGGQQQGGQQQGSQKSPQSDREKFQQDQQKKRA